MSKSISESIKIIKMKSIIKISLVLFLFGAVACEKPLEEEVFSELAPSTLFTTESGINAVLNSAYSYSHHSNLQESWSPFYLQGMPTDELWGAGGSIENLWQALINFNWTSTHAQIVAVWTVDFNAIRDANVVLDNLDPARFSADFVKTTTAEVNFIRGWVYSELYNLFGPVPLYRSSTDDPLQPRASDAETRAFIEQELEAAIANLPDDPIAFGRGSKGTARGVLCKYYMNTRQWQKAADVAKQIIDSGKFGLVDDYASVFAIANEGNKEMIWALPKDGSSTTASQSLNALLFPPDYPRPYPNNAVFAARTYVYDAFVNSFEASDTRKNLIVTEYVSTTSGNTVPGLGSDKSFPYKYEFDPNSVGFYAGNDLPVVRYADILMCRAEALNEISGPTQEAVDLVNQVRNRAKASPWNLADYNKESFRNALLEERAREFFFEAKRREDLLRQDRFISGAVARGKNAKDFHKLYPIPQIDLDANSLLTQNDGY